MPPSMVMEWISRFFATPVEPPISRSVVVGGSLYTVSDGGLTDEGTVSVTVAAVD